jgi:hypothetical protein
LSELLEEQVLVLAQGVQVVWVQTVPQLGQVVVLEVMLIQPQILAEGVVVAQEKTVWVETELMLLLMPTGMVVLETLVLVVLVVLLVVKLELQML